MKRKNRIPLSVVTVLAVVFMMAVSCDKKDSPDNNVVIPPDTTNNVDTTGIPQGWKKLGDWTANDIIWAITSDGSGNVYVAGYFKNQDGYCYVAKWNGTSWSELGSLKANAGIYSLTCDNQGHVYAVGAFTNGAVPGGGQAYVAMWDGTKWNDIGGGGGTFISSDDAGHLFLERQMWTGSAWVYLCTDCPMAIGGSIYSIIANPDGSVRYAAGDFSLQSGYRWVAKCDGSNCWSELGSIMANARINAMAMDKDGNIYAAGAFTDGNLPTTGHQYVAKWDGSEWSKLGNLNANGELYYLAVDPVSGNVYVSGYNTNTAGESTVVKWNGTTWSDLGNMRIAPAAIHVDKNGKLYSVVAAATTPTFTVVVHD